MSQKMFQLGWIIVENQAHAEPFFHEWALQIWLFLGPGMLPRCFAVYGNTSG